MVDLGGLRLVCLFYVLGVLFDLSCLCFAGLVDWGGLFGRDFGLIWRLVELLVKI